MSSNVPLLVRLEVVRYHPAFCSGMVPDVQMPQLVFDPNAISRYRFSFRVLGIHLLKRARSGAKL